MQKVKMKVTSCATLKTSTPGLLAHLIIVKAKNMKKLPFANIRLTSQKGEISRNVRNTMKSMAAQFVATNNGINVCAHQVVYNVRSGEVEIQFKSGQGQQNGGHLEADALYMQSDAQAGEAEIFILVFTGLTPEVEHMRPETLNAQRDVPIYAHVSYAGGYDLLKDALKGTPVYSKIGWMPNEADVSPRDVIQTFALMNIWSYPLSGAGGIGDPHKYVYGGSKLDNDTPNLVGTPDMTDPKNRSVLKYGSKMLSEMLYLVDYVQFSMPDVLAKKGVRNLDISTIFVSYEKDKRGYIVVDNSGNYVRKRVKMGKKLPLHFLWDVPNASTPRKLAKTYLFPILFGLRALIDRNRQWVLGSLDETKKFWDNYGGDILAEMDEDFFKFLTNRGRGQRPKIDVSPDEYGRQVDPYELCQHLVQMYLSDYLRANISANAHVVASASA